MKLQGPRPRARISREFIPNDCLSRWPAALDRTHGFGESLAPNGPLPSFLIFLGQPATPPDAVPVNRRQGQGAKSAVGTLVLDPPRSSVLRIQRKPRVRHGRGMHVCNGARPPAVVPTRSSHKSDFVSCHDGKFGQLRSGQASNADWWWCKSGLSSNLDIRRYGLLTAVILA